METNQSAPNFRVALSVEEIKGLYTCSLDVFLGNIKVWTSGYFSQFYMTEKCVLELTKDGDLELKGPKEEVGWRSGTSGQGVEVTNKVFFLFSFIAKWREIFNFLVVERCSIL